MVAVRRSSFSMETWNWTVFILLRLVILHPLLISPGTLLCNGRYNSPLLYKSEPSSFEFVTSNRDKFEYNNVKNNNLIPSSQGLLYPVVQTSSPVPTLSFDSLLELDQTEESRANQLVISNNNNSVNNKVIQKRFLSQNPSDRYDQEEQFKGWTNIDDEKTEEPVWTTKSSPSAQPQPQSETYGKTVDFLPPLPSLNILEDPGYEHGAPTWPLNEYLVDKFHSLYRPFRNNKTETEGTKHHHFHHNLYNNQYEWQQLQPSQHFGSSTSGSDNIYNTKFYDNDRYRNRDPYSIYNGNHVPNHNHHHHHHRHQSWNENVRGQESGTNEHTATVSTATDVKGSSNSANDASSNRGAHHKYGYGWPAQPGYFPPDHYPKKRFRLQIHPGYIAAPLAGLAAFGAASALTKKPLLFELGLVNNKYPYRQYGHYPQGIHYPGQGWASNIVPVVPPIYPQVNPPILTSGGLVPQIPILKPEASHHHNSHIHSQGHHHHNHLNNHHHHNHHNHGHHQAETDKKPWWNPFAALTPRD